MGLQRGSAVWCAAQTSLAIQSSCDCVSTCAGASGCEKGHQEVFRHTVSLNNFAHLGLRHRIFKKWNEKYFYAAVFQQNPILKERALCLQLFCSSALEHCRTSHPTCDSGQTSACLCNSDLSLPLHALVLSLTKGSFLHSISHTIHTPHSGSCYLTAGVLLLVCDLKMQACEVKLMGPAGWKRQSPSPHTSVS